MQVWQEFLQLQENNLGKETVDKWLRSLKVTKFDACNLYLEAEDSFQANFFEEHVRKKAEQELLNPNQKKIKIHLALPKPPKKKREKKKEELKKDAPFALRFDALDPTMSFESFVHSKQNELPYRLFLSLTGLHNEKETPDLSIANPIFLWGPSGSGKSHLLQAVAKTLKDKGLKVLYTRAETFTEHVVSAIRASEMAQFRKAYRSVDVLIIDDVHTFSKKNATQEEFFHTFNTLHVAGKQLILSALCMPGELKEVEPRLVSRFEWGISVPLVPLEKSHWKEVIKKKKEAFSCTLTPELEDFLQRSFKSNLKSAIGALEALLLRRHTSSFFKEKSSSEQVKEAERFLADLLQEESKSVLSEDRILQSVAKHFGIRPSDILGKVQSRECVIPRQIAMYLCREELEMPFTKIGDFFHRDHSTVISAIRQIKKHLDQKESDVASALFTILKDLRNIKFAHPSFTGS